MDKKKNVKKYHCNLCDFHSNNSYDFTKHNDTMKHKKRYFNNDNNEKTQYHCACGNFYCFQSGLIAHKKVDTAITTQNDKLVCEFCHKKYARVDIKRRHLKRCKMKQDMIKNSVETIDILQDELKRKNKELEKKDEEIKEKDEQIKYMIPKIGNNSTFNLQVYLKEDCKDALNLAEFVTNMCVKPANLDLIREEGITKGLAKLMIRGLDELGASHRPIQCTDAKRETLYVKDDDDAWKKDEQQEKVKGTIQAVRERHLMEIPGWQSKHPEYMTDESQQTQYLEMVKEMWEPVNEAKVTREVAKNTIVEKKLNKD